MRARLARVLRKVSNKIDPPRNGFRWSLTGETRNYIYDGSKDRDDVLQAFGRFNEEYGTGADK